jgi:HD-GYP domain-containing protein (c-di-GMP phosphodiesterase class II)
MGRNGDLTGGSHLQTREIVALRELVRVIDERDAGLAGHSELVATYAAATARAMGLDARQVARLRLAGIVHDVGKLTVPDAILAKPGPLTPAEWRRVRNHPEQGAWLVAGAGLQDVSQWVLTHHERIDGRGYPHGLQGADIPIEGRILAVVDAYEAMTTDRVYRAALSDERAHHELRRHAGTQFDPRVVEAFLAIPRLNGSQAALATGAD